MRAFACAILLGAALLGAAPARADCTGPGPLNAISVRPLAFFNHGVSAQYERFVAPPRLSLALGPEVRWGAHGDYSATTIGLGLEPRVWLDGRPVFGCLGARAMVGPFLGARVDVALTRVRDEVYDRSIGSLWSIAPAILVGARVNAWNVEITPSVGLGAQTELGGGLAFGLRPTIKAGFTVGWMF